MKNEKTKTKSKTKIVILSLLTLLVATTIGILVFEMVYKDSAKRAERQQALGDYSSSIEMQSIGVSLKENGKTVSWRDKYNSSTGEWSENEGKLLTGMVGERREVSARENISRRNSSIQFRRNRPVL